MKKLTAFVTALLLGAFLVAQEPAPSPTPAPAPTPPSAHDINYAFGLLMGQGMAKTGLDFDLDAVLQGLKDSLNKGSKPLFDHETATRIVNEAVKAAQAKVLASEEAKEQSNLETNGKKPGVKTTASGLQYEVLQEGTGPHPALTDVVEVNYVGTLYGGAEFDSSTQHGGPAKFTLEQVIPAWTEGIQLMTVGAKYRFTVPSKLAYGSRGAGNVIPPYATLVFEVELVSVTTPPPPKNPTAELAPDPTPEPTPSK